MLAISAVNVTRSYGARTVLSGVTLDISPADRIGVVGANGSGKSTLLRILANEAPDGGRVTRHPRLEVGLLPQELTGLGGTTWESALDAVAEVLALRRRWGVLADAIGDAPHDAALLDEYGTVLDALERVGGFQIEATIRQVLSGLGLARTTWDRPATSLSGGERTRLNLARTLLRRPDVLLLDEPTNHLDVGAIEWLETFLARFPGAVIAASHDRRFLDVVAHRILELDGGTAREYPGNYSAYAAAKAQALAARVASGPKRGRDHYGRIAKKVARGANAAQQRLAWLEARGPRKPIEPDRAWLRFDAAERPGAALAHFRSVAQRYGARPVLAGVNLTLRRGDRVGLVGANGSGKTSDTPGPVRTHQPPYEFAPAR